jgi:hypothetical protein
MPPGEGILSFPGGRAGAPVASETNLAEAGRNPAKPDMSVSNSVRPPPPPVLVNARRKRPLIARRTAHQGCI